MYIIYSLRLMRYTLCLMITGRSACIKNLVPKNKVFCLWATKNIFAAFLYEFELSHFLVKYLPCGKCEIIHFVNCKI